MFRISRQALMRASAAVAVGVVLAVSAGGAAQAASPNLIDPSALGSITVHKFESPPGGDSGLPNDGSAIDPSQLAGLTPLAGVTYTLQRVDPATYDLTTNQGWTNLSSLTVEEATTAPFDSQASATTAAEGVAAFANLPVGVYLVTETGLPPGGVPSAPFLVTVPLTNPNDTTQWLYDVNVYPKDDITTASKTVSDTTAIALGDPVVWTITSDIPQATAVDGYRIADPIASQLTYALGSTIVALGGTPLVFGVDYAETYAQTDPALADPVLFPNTLQIDLLAPGLAKLEADPAGQVSTTVKTTVAQIGEIPNTAWIYPDLASQTITPGQPGGPTPTDDPVTKFGNVTLHKTSTVDPTINLAGAKFAVYPTLPDAQNDTNRIDISGVSTWATDANGNVTIDGLRFSGWADNQALLPSDPGYQPYYVAEIAAPSGYDLLAQPVQVVVDDLDNEVDYLLADPPHNGGFPLPFTGSMIGASLFYGAGAVILAGAILLLIRSRRKAAARAHD
ncbi:SpaH/EbpB family LPXTG-anchored major pilin [Rathayibacter sp. YIM 133350]|uniref:SpaH/EbpB family LPXTG-anchored major pilin n=1 Tax=Rathayibacter sp. YIM 133350 TaxID=3131992 RepID=UPI00307E2431